MNIFGFKIITQREYKRLMFSSNMEQSAVKELERADNVARRKRNQLYGLCRATEGIINEFTGMLSQGYVTPDEMQRRTLEKVKSELNTLSSGNFRISNDSYSRIRIDAR